MTHFPFKDKIKQNGWCLDLGCGAGRYAEELAMRGMNVFGLDLSFDLLKSAYHGNSAPGSIHYVRGDMRRIPSCGSFDLVISMFTSFGYFEDAENEQIIRDLPGVMQPDGMLVLDVANPVMVRLAVNSAPVTERKIDGLTVIEERFLDENHPRVLKRIEIITNEFKKKYIESVKLFKREEIEDLFVSNGFRFRIPCWGDYDGSKLSCNSPRMIFFGFLNG